MRARLVVLAAWLALVGGLSLATPNGLLLGGIALASGTYAILRWRPNPSCPIVPTVRLLWFLPVTLGVLGPSLAGLTNSHYVVARLTAVAPDGAWLVFGSVCAVVGLALTAAFFWPEHWHPWTFPAVAVLVATAAKLAFVATVWAHPVSDFAGMWRVAGDVAEGGIAAALPDAQNHLQGLHFQRSLLYLIPLRAVFGASRWAYVIPNCLLTVGSSLLTFWLARRFFGTRAGRIALALSLLAIEPVLAAGIPTHDNPGTFLTLAVLVVFLAANRFARETKWRSALAAGVALGVLLALLDLQRNTRSFVVLAIALLLAGNALVDLASRQGDDRRWRIAHYVVFCFVVPVLVTASADVGLRAAGLLMPREASSYWKHRAIAAHTDSWSSGRYRHAVDEYYDRYDLDVETWWNIAWRKALTDTVRNPEARLAFHLRKSARMFNLGSQYAFYLPKASHFRSGEEVPRRFRINVSLVNQTYVLLFLVLTVAGTLVIWFDRATPACSLLPAIYLGISLTAVLLAFQPQPRYAFQIWYIGSIYAAALFRSPIDAHEVSDEAA